LQLISLFFLIDQEALELNFEQEGEQMALMLSIPVVRAKEEDEIKAIIEAEEKAKEAEKEAEAEDSEDAESESEEESEETDEDIEEEVEEDVFSDFTEGQSIPT
jgi:hypothetical protein